MRLLTTDEVAEMTGLPSRETLAQWRWLKKEISFVRLDPTPARMAPFFAGVDTQMGS